VLQYKNLFKNKFFKHLHDKIDMARPFGSKIRQNLTEILFYLKKGYGYELHKLYCQLFDECTREVVYYHLKRGVDRGEFTIAEVSDETGNYSWGPSVRKIKYGLGKNAKPNSLPIKEKIEQLTNRKL
jgi:hypothetical protein